MRLYFSLSTLSIEYGVMSKMQAKYILFSYYHARGANSEFLNKLAHENLFYSVMLDSGAYSVWTKGGRVDISDYLEFSLDFISKASMQVVVVNLDVIPGRWGRKPSAKEREDAAQRGWANYCKSRKRIPNVMHVFHQHESWRWLGMLADSSAWIGISPANDVSKVQKAHWLDGVFSYLYKGGYLPNIYTHAFGMTSLDLLLRYPFYSADSISWKRSAMYGDITQFDGFKLRSSKAKDIRDRRARCPVDWVGYEIGTCSDKYISAIAQMQEMEHYITNIWAKRGITWDG